jgi:nucleotide-binding universal stress UspA family protein
MYSRILVPLDGSGRAEAILPHAEELARCHGAELLLLQVVEPAPVVVTAFEGQPIPPLPEDMEARLSEAETYLNGLVGEMRNRGVQCRMLVVQGPIVESVIGAANGHNVDLIAMASHGRSGLSRVFYGSVAAGVLQRIDRPLLLIRSRDA